VLHLSLVDLLFAGAAADLLLLDGHLLAVDAGQFPGTLLGLLLLALLLALRHDELVGADALVQQVEVQHDQVDQQQHEDGVDAARHPRRHEAGEEAIGAGLQGECQQRQHVQEEIAEGSQDHHEEGAVVDTANAVVYPHAVVVEVLNAPVARPAVPRTLPHEAAAVVAEQQLCSVTAPELIKSAYRRAYSSRE
jgi:hypothetical protein